MKLSFQHPIPEGHKLTTYFAFCFPHSYTECQHRLSKLEHRILHTCDSDGGQTKEGAGQCRGEEVYYHRELLCRSLDGLRVDLITVSSHEGITADRESRLPGLFPDVGEDRARRFSGKKVHIK